SEEVAVSGGMDAPCRGAGAQRQAPASAPWGSGFSHTKAQRHEASLKSVRAELVEALFFFSTSQRKNGPSTSSGQTGLQRPLCLCVRNSALARLARPRMTDDAVDQPPVFGGRRRHGREDRFPAAAEQRAARRDEGGKAHGGCFRLRGVAP